MDDSLPRLAAPTQCAPKLALPPDSEESAGFIPMRLLMEPSGFTVDVDKPEVLVGRHSAADVRITMPDVSRRHCRFVFSDGSWRVFDLSSLNGVFVNEEKLNESILVHGDRVRLGGLTFKVELGKAKETQPLRKAS